MAAEEKPISMKRKKRRRRSTEEEVVITLGKPPGEEEPEEEEEFEEKDMEEEEEEELESDEEPEEDEDVVVISIGKPPEKEEEVLEEEIEEAIEVEGEPVEVEVEEEKPPEEEEALKRMKLAAIIIAIIVVISSIGIYVIFVLNKDPVAKLQLSPESAFAGQLVLMDASNSTDDKGIEEYTWSFGDQTAYTETQDSHSDGKFDGKTTHTYDEGDYTVKLTVKDDEGRTGTASSHIAVSELVVTIPFEKIGDDYTYDVNGSVDVENNDGIWIGTTSLGKFTLKNVHIDFDGYMLSKVEGVTSQEDGFGESHQTLERYNFEDVELEGTVSGTLTTESPPSTIDTTLPIQDGSLEVTERDYTDLTTNKTIFSDTESYLIISAGSGFDVWSDDHLRSYSNLREKSAVLRIEDLSPDRSFKMDDGQTQRVGDISYTWRVESVANIMGYPALGIEIDIDETTKRENNIEEFEMWLWITNNIPLPIKTYIYTEIYFEGTTTIIIYNNEVQQDGFQRGTTDIPYGDCFASSPDDHYHFRNPGYEFLSWDNGEYIPDLGSNSSSLNNFPPQDALAFAEANSGGLQGYLASYPNAYVIDGHYNDTKDDPPLWNLTFGDLNADTAYYVVVEDNGGSYSLNGEATIDAPELVNSSSDFDLVLSFSAGEQVFESDEEINQSVFLGGNIRFYDGINYGVRANMIYPSISLTISLTLEHAEYGYYLEDDDGSFSAAVDAINGQLIYVWEHEGDDILSLIIG